MTDTASVRRIPMGSTMKNPALHKKSFSARCREDFARNRTLYIIFIPVFLYYAIFCYKPMYGAIIAFKNFVPSKGIIGSDWVGFRHFESFFQSAYFLRILKNTLVISINSIIFGFPAPIILALMINELKSKRFSKVVQTISYLPHFISLVVICALIKDFTADTGIINDIIAFFGGERVTMLNQPKYFVPVYVVSEIWQEVGWGSIIYIAALAGIDQELYEAADIDGAGKIKQLLNITIPSIIPTIMIMLILKLGNIMNIGYEKVLLLYSPAVYETSDIISTYVYRKGILDANYSFSTAVGLFNSVINFAFLLGANKLSNISCGTGLW